MEGWLGVLTRTSEPLCGDSDKRCAQLSGTARRAGVSRGEYEGQRARERDGARNSLDMGSPCPSDLSRCPLLTLTVAELSGDASG